MIEIDNDIKTVNLANTDLTQYKKKFVGCLILSNTNHIILQLRGEDFESYPGFLSEFGGEIEKDETPDFTLFREIKEELGATISAHDVIKLGAITEASSQHEELIFAYFWHDKNNIITGCYEGTAKYFANIKDILAYPKIMPSTKWLLNECQERHLFLL